MAKSFKVESGIQLLARLNKKPSSLAFYPQLFPSGLKPGEVVEIVYNEGAPKCLLTDLICATLLPSDYGGAGTSVLIFNCSGSLNYDTLMKSMAKKILISGKIESEKEVNDIIQKQLNNLFSVEIHDATQYYTTIYNLENVLLEHPNITMILFDTITAFYWSEHGVKIMRMDTYLKTNLSIIQNVTKEHKVIVIYAKPHYFYSGKDGTNTVETFNELCSVDGVTHRISVSFEKDSVYLTNIQSNNMQLEKRFYANEDLITWL